MRARPLLVFFFSCCSMGAAIQGGWTSRMGLQFRDDCQEHLGLVASMTAWIGSFFGLRAHTGEVCESKEMRCPADTSVTALQVHFGRDERYDRDFYDFKLRCGTRWQRYLGLRFESPDKEQEESVLCPGIKPASGIQVLRGRQRHGDKDYYGFKLRCAAQWQPLLGLEYEGHQETKVATCPRGHVMRGLRVHRGFLDWGDRDSYEFQLLCELAEAPTQGGGRTTTFGGRQMDEDAKAQLMRELREMRAGDGKDEL